MKKEWYKNSYRRNLVDMHIEDWDDEFLSKFSPEEYLNNLKTASIQSTMIYFQNHNGLCYFPSAVGEVHKKFQESDNKILRLVNLCHENDIDVIGYYSIIYNTKEEEKHPEWRIRNKNGQSLHELGGRYGHLCPNNPEHREFVKTQVAEMLDFFDVDGMFYDMPFWPQYCSCDYCASRWTKETGIKEMPMDINYKNPDFILHMKKRAEWIGEFVKLIEEHTKKLRPGVTVEFNCAAIIANETWRACTELVNDACDYTGGDLYGSLFNHSFAAKYYRTITKNQPCEYMTCRCDNTLYQHTITKTENYLDGEIMLNVANHAATLVIDAIDPRGTMDKRVYERIGKIFEKEKKYEPYMTGRGIYDVGVLYFDSGKYNTHGQNFDHKSASVAAVHTLIQNNVAFNVDSGSRAKLEDYKCVISPAITGMPKERAEDILAYVENGGSFYFSGAEEGELIKLLLGGEYVRMSEYITAYVAPKKTSEKLFCEFNKDFPLPVGFSMPVIKLSSTKDVAAFITYPYTVPGTKKFASIHSNPPGVPTKIPALVIKKIGKGKVVWSAAPIEADERDGIRAVFSNIIDLLLPKSARQLTSTAPKRVELITYERDGKTQINAVDTNATNERIPLPAFKVRVACENRPTALRSITKDKEIPFSWNNGFLTFTVRSLTAFEMFETV